MRGGNRRKARAGVTLLEVMLAGALTAISVLATLEAFIVAAKIAHENAEALRADSDAFDAIWGRFNIQFGELSNSTTTNDFTFVPSSACFIDLNYTYQLHGQEHSLWIRRSNVPNDRTFGVEDQ